MTALLLVPGVCLVWGGYKQNVTIMLQKHCKIVANLKIPGRSVSATCQLPCVGNRMSDYSEEHGGIILNGYSAQIPQRVPVSGQFTGENLSSPREFLFQ